MDVVKTTRVVVFISPLFLQYGFRGRPIIAKQEPT
jgi:hypothetical protein